MRTLRQTLALTVVLVSTNGHADLAECRWGDDRTVTVIDRKVQVTQGRDQSRHGLEVEIWGPERIALSCENLDSDPEHELIISSRGIGSGPYYRLQIVDFAKGGILAWSYRSDGAPRAERRRVFLGSLEGGYTGAGSVPIYTAYAYLPAEGLVDTTVATRWMQFLKFEADGQETTLIAGEFRSKENCEFDGETTMQEFERIGIKQSYSCLSNLELEKMLEEFTN